MTIESTQFFPPDDRLKKRAESEKPAKPSGYYETLTVVNKGAEGEITPLAVGLDKRVASAEAEALAKRRLEISIQLEKKVEAWFKLLTSSGLDADEVKKEIGDFLDTIEKSANASNVIDLKQMPRAPEDFYSYRLYQLLRALVDGKKIEKDTKPGAYIKFDMEGPLSMFSFMTSLAEKAEAHKRQI